MASGTDGVPRQVSRGADGRSVRNDCPEAFAIENTSGRPSITNGRTRPPADSSLHDTAFPAGIVYPNSSIAGSKKSK